MFSFNVSSWICALNMWDQGMIVCITEVKLVPTQNHSM